MEKIEISKIKENPENPRFISDGKFKKLVKSLKDFPEMLEIRPLVVNSENMVLGGNMRLRAARELGLKKIPILKAENLTPEQEREFIVKDNVGYGEWDWDTLGNEWEADLLEDWGLDIPDMTETERLSDMAFQDIYYEPEEEPNINLEDCVDLELFEKKTKAIEEAEISKEMKKVMRLFAYRFIRIDFERVANYYFFNANEEEKKIMERLRLVLCDGGVEGFIEDDILKIHGLIEGWND